MPNGLKQGPSTPGTTSSQTLKIRSDIHASCHTIITRIIFSTQHVKENTPDILQKQKCNN